MVEFTRIANPCGPGTVEITVEESLLNFSTRSPALEAHGGRAGIRRYDNHLLPELRGLEGPLAPRDLLHIACLMVAVRAAPTERIWTEWKAGVLRLSSAVHYELRIESGLAFPWEALVSALRVWDFECRVRDNDERSRRAITAHLHDIARDDLRTRTGARLTVEVVTALFAIARREWRLMKVFAGKGRRLPRREDPAFEALRLGSYVRFRSHFRRELRDQPSLEALGPIDPYWAPASVRPHIVGSDDPALGVCGYARLVQAIQAELRGGRAPMFVAHCYGLSEAKLDMVLEDARLLAAAAS